MKRNVMMVACFSFMLTAYCSTTDARESRKQPTPSDRRMCVEVPYDVRVDRRPGARGPQVAAVQSTVFLAYYTFDSAGGCTPEGWTSHDLTEQTGDYWHVDDFVSTCGPGTFGRLLALEGSQSMWCGVCPDPNSDILCGYAVLPGYGNDWDQSFGTKACLSVDSNVVIDYLVAWDTETGYDAMTVEIDHCDGNWVAIYGGVGVYDGVGKGFASVTVPDSLHGDSLRVRFHFVSDNGWSDQDELWDTDGAFILDSLSLSDASGTVLVVEDFEDESVGDNDTNDWESYVKPGYGDYAQLSDGTGVLQEDPCHRNFTCLWNFYKGSTYDYSCHTPNPIPWQPVVPYENERGQYLTNEIWSPVIPYLGSGYAPELAFDVYSDHNTSALIYYIWKVRSFVDGCPTEWQYHWCTSCYGGPTASSASSFTSGGSWSRRSAWAVGGFIDPAATHIQFALGVLDMCEFWCGVWGDGECHGHGPLFDNVEVYVGAGLGPQYYWEDERQFQDTFSSDGTITGTARIDAANDVLHSSTAILPGDSAVISVTDPASGLTGDLFTGWGPAVYCYVSVRPQGQPSKTAASIQSQETRVPVGLRWPHVGDLLIDGDEWHVFRMDSCFSSDGRRSLGNYCIDLNDNLFTPGDTVYFFYGAENTVGAKNYYVGERHRYPYTYDPVYSLVEAAANADECTILPAGGYLRGGEILYVNGATYDRAHWAFETSFKSLNIDDLVDRFDIRRATLDSGAGQPSGRVVDPVAQLASVYRQILWNCGNSGKSLGDASGSNDNSDDTGLLKVFLDNLPSTGGALPSGGVYLDGDDVAEVWDNYTSANAQALRSYLSYTVDNTDHAAAGAGVSPWIVGTGNVFALDDTVFAYGGCPTLNEFDVLSSSGTSVVEANYVNTFSGVPIGGAVVRQVTTNPNGALVAFILSGLSFHNIRDYDYDGIADRSEYLNNILAGLGGSYGPIIGMEPDARRNSLAQNYPNPFNPTTTIAYTIKEPGRVSLKVYNVAGQLVKTLVDEIQRPDAVKPIHWDGRNNTGQRVSSGVYFYKLVTKGFTKTKKMVLLK